MGIGFVQRQAEAYKQADWQLAPWKAYADEVLKQWEALGYSGGIQLVSSANTYLTQAQLTQDIKSGEPIRVWRGGRFYAEHPLTGEQFVRYSGRVFQRYQISRALHDYTAHYKRKWSFSAWDELCAAYHGRRDFGELAQRAQWTDDVAMSCYYSHFGEWPKIQYPKIVEPDWKGLREFLIEGKE